MKFFSILVLATAASAMVMPRHHNGQNANNNANNNAVGNNNNANANANANANNANANAANAAACNNKRDPHHNGQNANANNANAAACNNNNKREPEPHHNGQNANANANANKGANANANNANANAANANANAANAAACNNKRDPHHNGQNANNNANNNAAAAANSLAYEAKPLAKAVEEFGFRRTATTTGLLSTDMLQPKPPFRSSWNVDPSTGTYTPSIRSPTGLPTDPSLTSHGVQQANDLATHLLNIDPPVEQVYSSPYYRCMQTIQPFVHNLRTRLAGNVSGKTIPKIRVDTALSEWYGLAQFEHPSSAPLNELQSHFPELDATYASTLAPSSRGESLPQLHDRVAQAVDAIIRRSDEEGHRAVLISTHAAVVIALGRVLTGQMERDFGAFTCGLSKYRRRNPCVAEASTRDGEEAGTNADPLAASSERQIGDTGSTTLLGIDSIDNADLHPHDSRRPPLRSLERGKTGLYGGWTCELDSDCSFLRGGEERGWKFSGDESFIETDGSGSWLEAGSGTDTAGDRPETESRKSHISPKAGISKL
ncbi:hypothetical protein Hte_002893 [Hypoxylon texense]